MNKLQNLYEKINPADDPETMAEQIIARAATERDSEKTRRPGRLALAACVAAALIVVIPATASAMVGTNVFEEFVGKNIFEVFKSYFNTQEMNPVGVVEYHKPTESEDKTTEPEDYKLTINGFAADRHCVCISYDIEYKDPFYFENGELRPEVLERCPVSFEAEPQVGDWRNISSGRYVVSVDGATVSYVFVSDCSSDFFADPSKDEYFVKISYICEGVNPDGSIREKDIRNPDEVIYARIPATKDITLRINEEVSYPNGEEGVLNRIELNSLSVYFFTTNDEPLKRSVKMELFAPKLFFKDGTVLDLAEGLAEGERVCGGGQSQQGNGPERMNCYYIYGTVIDPETIEAVELFGKTYTVEQYLK